MRRGLTLVEALAATMLLTTIAVAVVPLLAGLAAPSVGRFDPDVESPDPLTLMEFAARIATSPARFGITDDGVGPWVVDWPDGQPWPPVSVAVLDDLGAGTRKATGGDVPPAVGGRWLIVRCGNVRTLRWIAESPGGATGERD